MFIWNSNLNGQHVLLFAESVNTRKFSSSSFPKAELSYKHEYRISFPEPPIIAMQTINNSGGYKQKKKKKRTQTLIQWHKLLNENKICKSNLCWWLVRDAVYPFQFIYHWALRRTRSGTFPRIWSNCHPRTWDNPKSKHKMTELISQAFDTPIVLNTSNYMDSTTDWASLYDLEMYTFTL